MASTTRLLVAATALPLLSLALPTRAQTARTCPCDNCLLGTLDGKTMCAPR